MSTVDGASVSSNEAIKDKNESKSSKKDEDICDDWEQLDQQQIKKSLQSIKITQANDNEEKNLKSIAKPNTNSFPSNNSMANNPIKILRRPPSDKNLKEMNVQNATTVQPIKTFEQREQEYAQARLRILGSAHPEQDTSSTGSDNYTNNNPQKNVSNQQLNYSQNMPVNRQIDNNPANNVNSGNSNYNNKNSNFNLNNNSIGNSLVRDPIGPAGDGSRGFNNNRYFNNNQNNSNSNNNSYKNKS